jgi:peptide deformylase
MTVDSANLRIVTYPDPALREKAEPVAEITPEAQAVARRMIELMREAEGIGLAAPQVGLGWRLFVCDVPPAEDRPLDSDPPQATDGPIVCFNPELSDFSDDLESYEEGCLSLPEIVGDVRRPAEVTLTATGLDGERFTRRLGGLLARCAQHEIDHLDGVLIIDKMQQLSRMKNRRAIKELESLAGAR